MKYFVVFTCALAAASAGIIAPIHAPLLVSGPQHLPVIGANGVPVDTLEVQHARAVHLAHKVEAHARNGDLALVGHSGVLAHSAIAAPILSQHLPVIGPNGVPVDTIAVQQARAAHLSHKVEAHVRNGDLSVVAHSAPVLAHASPLAYAHHGVAGIHHLVRRGLIHSAPLLVASGPQHLPVIGANGVPVDTIEVQHARAAHLAHKVEAHARNGDLSVVAHSAPILAHAGLAGPVLAHSAIASPIVAHHAAVAHAIPAAYPTTLGLPAVTANGIPLETPEVVAAKSNHFAAHAEALARNSPIISNVAIAAPIASVW